MIFRASASGRSPPRASAASRYQRLRQFRQKPARFMRSMFCTSLRSRRCATRARKAAASSSVRVAGSSISAVMDVSYAVGQMARRARVAIVRPMSEAWSDIRARKALRAMFDAGVAAADPRVVLAAHLPPPPAGRCVVVGAGKAAATMAAAVEAAWPEVALTGVVVTRDGHAVADRANRGAGGLAPRARRPQRGGRTQNPGGGGRARAGRPRAGAGFGWRLGAAGPSRAGADAGRQGGGEPRAARQRGGHHGDEHGAQAPLRHQGRTARRRRRARRGW